MHQGKFVFAQVIDHIPRYEFQKAVDKYKGNYKVKTFKCWYQFLCLIFGQLTHRESLRDIVTCLNAHPNKLYHMGIKAAVARSTLSKANEVRDWRIYADIAHYLIKQARSLYTDDIDFSLELDNAVYALDATTIDLCLSVFKWAKFCKNKGAIKLHTLMDMRGSIPVFIHISDGLTHDVNVLDILDFEPGAFYVMDRAYVDFERLYRIDQALSFFITRAKKNFKFRRIYSRPCDKSKDILCDQVIKLTGYYTLKAYPDKLRRIKFFDQQTNRKFVFLTNNFELTAEIICRLYKYRWQIELFFKWIKQHLKIKVFWGESANAVKTQIWIAVLTYVLVAIIKKRLKLERPIYEILQISSISIFEKVPVNQLLMNTELQNQLQPFHNQLKLF